MIRGYGGFSPDIHPTAFLAETAVIVGDVRIGSESSIWFNTVVRGDVNRIRIGCRTNIQDQCMLHVTGRRHADDSGAPLIIGDDVTVGHAVTLHGCSVENGAFIGMNAVVLDRCVIGQGAMVAAGSVVPEGTVIPPGTLWVGSPARYRRDLTDADRQRMGRTTAGYLRLSAEYRTSLL
jgi:carbonic anhydrase/acetyltransferase-like protein (isoleucine patch superfamily)